MRFHEAVAAMAKGECVQSNGRSQMKLNNDRICYWNGCHWSLCYELDSHELSSQDWKIVPDPSIKPLTFSEAMKAIEEGKAVRSCTGCVHWLNEKNMVCRMTSGRDETYFTFTQKEIFDQWHIVPVPEVKS